MTLPCCTSSLPEGLDGAVVYCDCAVGDDCRLESVVHGEVPFHLRIGVVTNIAGVVESFDRLDVSVLYDQRFVGKHVCLHDVRVGYVSALNVQPVCKRRV